MLEYLCLLRRRLPQDVFETVTGRCSTCVNFIDVPMCLTSEPDEDAIGTVQTHSFAINVRYLIQSAARARCQICSILSAAVMSVLKRCTGDYELPNVYVLLQEKLCDGNLELVERKWTYHSESADKDSFGQPTLLACREIPRYCYACKHEGDSDWNYCGWKENLGRATLFRKRSTPGEMSNATPPSLTGHEPWNYLPDRRHIHRMILSRHTMGLARYWIDACDRAHPLCKTKSTLSARLAPDRLFDIGTNDSSVLKLVETQDLDVRYIALSYCWGATNTAATTDDNYGQRLIAIDLLELPQTYRDAILFARHLNVRHLWIDALCIVQNTSDFQKQMTKMSMIYEGAYLVIAADRALNTDTGFLQDRNLSRRIVTPYGNAQEAVIPALILAEGDDLDFIHNYFDTRTSVSAMDSTSKSNPVFRRAWCFQERLLARRVLHVTAQELIWECRTSIDCECGRLKDIAVKGLPTLRRSFGTLYANEATETSNTDTHISLRHWHHNVQWYSGCALSFAQDRLLAISGVARLLQSPLFGSYLAGLWECALPQELAWRSKHDDLSINTRDQVFVAPTWSWASIKGPVQWDDDVETNVLMNFAEVVSIHCEATDDDVFGRLRGGKLTLRCPVLKPLPRPSRDCGYYYIPPKPSKHQIHCSLAVVPGQFGSISIDAYIVLDVNQSYEDEQNKVITPDSLSLAFIHCQSNLLHGGWQLEWRALAIRPTSEAQGIYERVGLACSTYNADLLEKALDDWDGHQMLPLSIDDVIPSAKALRADNDVTSENQLKRTYEQTNSHLPSRVFDVLERAMTRTAVGRKPFYSHIVDPRNPLLDLKNMGAVMKTVTVV